MKNFHIKSIVLGIGIGFVITSIISLIYTAGNTVSKMSNLEIIEQAKKLGMVEDTSLINNNFVSSDSKSPSNNKTNEVKANTPQPTKLDTAAASEKPKTEGQEIKITVNQGEASETVSEKLLKAGLINDKASFLKELADLGLTSEINIGEFKIKTGTDMKAIIKLITASHKP